MTPQRALADLKSTLSDLLMRQLMIENYVALITGTLLYQNGKIGEESLDRFIERFAENVEAIKEHREQEGGALWHGEIALAS